MAVQEEIEQKSFNLMISSTKLSARLYGLIFAACGRRT